MFRISTESCDARGGSEHAAKAIVLTTTYQQLAGKVVQLSPTDSDGSTGGRALPWPLPSSPRGLPPKRWRNTEQRRVVDQLGDERGIDCIENQDSHVK